GGRGLGPARGGVGGALGPGVRRLGGEGGALPGAGGPHGGAGAGVPRDAFLTGRRRSRITVEVWPWLVGLVAVLLIPDIALRRLGPGAFGWVVGLARRGGTRKEVQ